MFPSVRPTGEALRQSSVMRMLVLALIVLWSVAVARGQDTTATAFESSSVTPATPHPAEGFPLPDECQIISKGLAFPAHQISDLVSFMTLPIPGRPAVNRPVIDRTGLEGYFRMVIRYEPIGATLLQQMQEQLRLKLTPAREVVDVLVIDSATMPRVD